MEKFKPYRFLKPIRFSKKNNRPEYSGRHLTNPLISMYDYKNKIASGKYEIEFINIVYKLRPQSNLLYVLILKILIINILKYIINIEAG